MYDKNNLLNIIFFLFSCTFNLLKSYKQVERLNGDYEEPEEPSHQGRRILPEDTVPAQAWIENEDLSPGNDSRTNSPGENRRLLGNKSIHKSNSRLQAGLTLGVWGIPKKTSKSQNLQEKPRAKTKFQKRKEKLFEALKPPYFIISMLFVIVSVPLFICILQD